MTKKSTEKELNKFLLVNMCRVQKMLNKTRIFDVLMSDVFHSIEEIKGKWTKEFFESVVFVLKHRDLKNPTLNAQPMNLKEYLATMIQKYKLEKKDDK